MSVSIDLNSEMSSVYFDEQEKYFVMQPYFYDGSVAEMNDNKDQIRLSFDQADANGDVLKDGNCFEMELEINSWQDVAEKKPVYKELINAFINQLDDTEKKWFKNQYKKAYEKCSTAKA